MSSYIRELIRRNPEGLSQAERAEREAKHVANQQGYGYHRRGEFIPSKSFVKDYTELCLKHS